MTIVGAEPPQIKPPHAELSPPGFRIAVAELLSMARPVALADIERLEGLVPRAQLSRQEKRDISRLLNRADARLSAPARRRLEALLRR